MATFKILMVGGRRCGKTTILSKIKTHFNSVLHHTPDDEIKNDLLKLLPPVESITRLNSAQDCINNMFNDIDCYTEFPIDENPTSNISTTTFKLKPLSGSGSLSLEFTDVPGEWFSPIDNNNEKHQSEITGLIAASDVILMAIDTPSLMEENGRFANYYNRINDIKDLFNTVFNGEIFKNNQVQKMILFIPLKCEKYIVNARGNVNIEKQKELCTIVEQRYAEMIKDFSVFSNNLTMAIIPIITIKEVEWARFYAVGGDTDSIYNERGDFKAFWYGGDEMLCSKFRFKPDLYSDVKNGSGESQSLYCEQPLIYFLVFLLKYHLMHKGILADIPILGALFSLFSLFDKNPAFELEMERLRAKKMKRGNDGFRILQNPLGI